jgi:hypothetical protein
VASAAALTDSAVTSPCTFFSTCSKPRTIAQACTELPSWTVAAPTSCRNCAIPGLSSGAKSVTTVSGNAPLRAWTVEASTIEPIE